MSCRRSQTCSGQLVVDDIVCRTDSHTGEIVLEESFVALRHLSEDLVTVGRIDYEHLIIIVIFGKCTGYFRRCVKVDIFVACVVEKLALAGLAFFV